MWDWNDVDQVFGICKERMISVENLEIEKWYEGGDTVAVKRSSHHLVPVLSSWIESYVDIQSVSLCDLCIQLILESWHG